MFSSTYKLSRPQVSFQFVPIPGVSNFAHGVKLRSTTLAPGRLSGPVFFFQYEHKWSSGPMCRPIETNETTTAILAGIASY
jgi:hypothetical protein